MKIIALLMFSILSVISGCPMKEDSFPCICHWPEHSSAFVICAELHNEQALMDAAGSYRNMHYAQTFIIKNSHFSFIPSNAFKETKFRKVEIRNTSFMALTDTDVAFQGLEDHLETLLMKDFTLMSEWDWSVFRNLRKLVRFEIIQGNLRSIDEEPNYSNSITVKGISFAKNRISHLHNKAFANFKKLAFLSLSGNLITGMKRSMFPEPTVLWQLDLSNNKIERLPTDIFDNMPKLELLSIANNKILVLKEETFTSIWGQLLFFGAIGNDLRCDCRLAWILNMKSPTDMRAVCTQPPNLKGKTLKDLTSKDLWCY